MEVSIRTIKRDVSALQQAGAPIWARTGPGGGYVLSESASLPPLNFTASQAVAVRVALAALPPGSPFVADAKTASSKVADALGSSELATARAVASRIWVVADDEDHPPDSATMRAVERALVDKVAVALVYGTADGSRTRRVVEPAVLALDSGRWYLVAHCRLRDDIRWFRLDRIARADLTRQRVGAPTGCRHRSAARTGEAIRASQMETSHRREVLVAESTRATSSTTATVGASAATASAAASGLIANFATDTA
ncbi:hypothetical protein BH20ACT2_BH20ACT2_13990 [soil metagenome]